MANDKMRWLGPLSAPLEKFLSGGSNADPLYLSNRTLGQRMKVWLLVGLPLVAVAGIVRIIITSQQLPSEPVQQKELTSEEIAQKTLPTLPKDLKVYTNTDLEVVEAKIEHGEPFRLTGSVRSKADHEIHQGEVVFDLTQDSGRQLGAVVVTFKSIPPGATAKFDQVIHQKAATFALVREIHTQ